MGVSVETGGGYVPGIDGFCTWRVQVTKNFAGETQLRFLQSATIDGRTIGREDERFDLIASHVHAI